MNPVDGLLVRDGQGAGIAHTNGANGGVGRDVAKDIGAGAKHFAFGRQLDVDF